MSFRIRPFGPPVGGWITFAFTFLASALALSATTIKQPSFAELARGADQVVHGKVISVRSFWADVQGRPVIRTAVAVEVIESIDGLAAGQTLNLRLLGGEIDGKGLRVDGMPQFGTNEEMVLFVRGNGRQVCPLLGWRHGQFMVERPAGGAANRVMRVDGSPVTGAPSIERALAEARHADPASAAAPTGNALDVRAFLDLVRQERFREADR